MPTLEFKGKQHIYAHHLTVPYSPLVVDHKKSHPQSSSAADSGLVPDDNLIIHGDNLRALKALLPRYAGKIDCIYIDPPYNTGNDKWIYSDNVNSPMMREWLAQNSQVDGEDLERHDKWLCMMWPRLQLLKELLADDGSIFVSIDHNEEHHLRMLLDEVFGEANFLASIAWHRSYSPQMDAEEFSVSHDYVMAYKASETGVVNREPFEQNTDQFRLTEETTGKPYRRRSLRKEGSNSLRTDAPTAWYPLTAPDGTVVFPFKPLKRGQEQRVEGVWRWSLETYEERLEAGEVEWLQTARDGWQPYAKQYIREVADRPPGTVWSYEQVGHTHDAADEVAQLLGPRAFATPKPVALIQRVIRIATGHKENPLILDSFAGSGTTAHATLALNSEDGGNRRFVLVECEAYADTVTAERVRRVINGVPEAKNDALQNGLGGSFSYCTLGDPFDAESLLSGEGLPDYETLAVFLIHTAAGLSLEPDALRTARNDQRFYRTDTTDYYLYYEPDVEWLKSDEAMLTSERAKRIQKENKDAVVFGAGKYLSQRELTEMGITFCQLPYELFRGG